MKMTFGQPYLSQIHLQVGFGFPDCFCMLGQCLCFPPRLSVPASTFCVLPFYVWVLLWVPSSSMQAFWCVCLASSLLRWTALELGASGPWVSTSFLGPRSLQGLIPQDSTKQTQEMARICSRESRVVIMLYALLPPLSILNSMISWSLQARWPLTFTSSRSHSLFVSVRSSRAPLRVVSLVAFVWKLSWMLCRNSLDCWYCAVLVLQQISGWLKSTVRTRACKYKATSGCL